MQNDNGDSQCFEHATIHQNVDLQKYNTLAVAVKARFLCLVQSEHELQSALLFAKNNDLNTLILGEGSNTVFTQDYDGLVLLSRLNGIEPLKEDADYVYISVAAGENWHDFVDYSLDQQWYGLENLALIPGLVGAAPIQNIGAYGVEVKDTIVNVTYVDLATGNVRTSNNSECEFEYRDSIFKNQLNGQTFIVRVEFRLSKKPTQQLRYPALAHFFEKDPNPRDIFNRVCEVRRAKLPMPQDIPNAGSFFKNPVVSAKQYQSLSSRYPTIVGFEQGAKVKLAAAWLIEHLGWKNKEIAGVKVHEKQSLVITNPMKKSGTDILLLAKAIQDDVAKEFDVALEIEPRIY